MIASADRLCRRRVGAIANGCLVFVAFLVSVPGLVLQTNRGWLKAFGWMIIVSAVFTLSLGLDIWFSTLKTRSNLRSVWAAESPEMQSLLQQRVSRPATRPCLTHQS